MPVNTSINPIVVVKDGVTLRLDTLAYNISTKSGIAGMSPQRGPSVVVPGRSGSLYKPGRKREDGSIILSMWVSDTTEDGVETSDPYQTWRANVDKILQVFDTSFSQAEIREYTTKLPSPGSALPSSGYRRAFVEVRSAIDPEVMGRTFGVLKIECLINDTYWEDFQVSSNQSLVGTSAAGTLDLTNFVGSTAPIEDSTLTVSGPVNNPRVTDVVSGHYIQLNQSLVSGQDWIVDSRTWSSTVNGTSRTADTISSGPYSPRLFGITPAPAGQPPKVSFSGGGMGTGTKLLVSGRRKFH